MNSVNQDIDIASERRVPVCVYLLAVYASCHSLQQTTWGIAAGGLRSKAAGDCFCVEHQVFTLRDDR